MQHLREVVKIAEWGLKNDQPRLAAYINQLIDKLKLEGDVNSVKRFNILINDDNSIVHQSSTINSYRLPVDSESRLALADEEFIKSETCSIILNQKVQERIDEFIQYVNKIDVLESHGVSISPSLITYGPPGTGKTQLAKYIASRLNMPLVVARADTLISSYLGSTSKNLRNLFDHISHRNCVLFLDDIDSFAKLRDDQQELGELKRVVVSLLQNIDAMNPETVLLAATNHEHLLDPAIWRRFTYKIPLKEPGINERIVLFKLFMGEYNKEIDLELISELSYTITGADIKTISQNSIRDAIINNNGHVNQDRLIISIIEKLTTNEVDFDRLDFDNLDNSTLSNILLRIKNINPKYFTQKKISKTLNLSESKVSRLLNKMK